MFIRLFVVASIMALLAGCVPSSISEPCKKRAISKGYGKCSVEKGRQNDAGVWLVKLDCSRGEVSCINNTAGSVSVDPWTPTSEFLFKN